MFRSYRGAVVRAGGDAGGRPARVPRARARAPRRRALPAARAERAQRARHRLLALQWVSADKDLNQGFPNYFGKVTPFPK